jgi:hypothetical protein
MLRPLGIGREGSKKCVCASRMAVGGAALVPPSPPPDEPALPDEPVLPDELASEPALAEEPALPDAPEEPALPDEPMPLVLPKAPAPGDVPEDEHPTSTASHVVAEAAMNFRRENTMNLALLAADLVVVDG